MKRGLIAAAMVAIVGVAALLIRDRGNGNGPLDGGAGGGHTSPMVVGAPYDHFSVGLDNRGDKPIEIERVRLVRVAGPVELIGVRARLVPDEGPMGGGGLVGGETDTVSFPLSERNILPVPTSYSGGTPDQFLQILFRVKMTEEGIGHSEAVEVTYRSGGKRYTEEYPFYMLLCAPREKYVDAPGRGCGGEPTPTGDGVLG